LIINTSAATFGTLRDLLAMRERCVTDVANLELTIASEKEWLSDQLRAIDERIANVREVIADDLRQSGEASLTDPDTGINAHFKHTTSWKVTSKDDLFAAAKERPDLGLIVEAVDEKAAIAYSKKSGEPLPGIESITNETFTIVPPKAKK
jgi:hypothetical protein